MGGCHLQPPFSPGSSRQPRSGHAPQPTTPSGVPTHPGKQLSAVFAGRPRGRLNTDHDSDADRVGPNSGQPGNTTPRGPSPPRIHSPMSAACTRVPPLTFCCASPPGRPRHCLRPQRSCPTMQHTSPSYTHDMSHHTFTLPHKSSTKHPCTPGADTQQRAQYTQHTCRVHRSTAYCAL